MVRFQLSVGPRSQPALIVAARGHRGHCRNCIVSGRTEHRQHDEPDHLRDRQRHSADRRSCAPSWGRSRRVTSGIWLCAVRVGPDSGHLRRRSADAGPDSADGLRAFIALSCRRHRFAASRSRRRPRLHCGNDQQDTARCPIGQACLSGQRCGRRRGAGAGIGAHRPAGRTRCVPRPVDCQSGARHRRGDRDRMANH